MQPFKLEIYNKRIFMKTHIFTTTYNEPVTLKIFIDWYRKRIPDCKITVYDNESNDNGETEMLCRLNNVELHSFNSNGKYNERILMNIRNSAWKNTDADFVIMCDSDELVDVRDKDLLENKAGLVWQVCKCRGVELFGDKRDAPDAFYGVDSKKYSKSVLFHKPSIKEMNFAPGSHTCSPVSKNGAPVLVLDNGFILYHTKWKDFDYGLCRVKQIGQKGRSTESKKMGWGFEYDHADVLLIDFFNNMYNKRKRYL